MLTQIAEPPVLSQPARGARSSRFEPQRPRERRTSFRAHCRVVVSGETSADGAAVVIDGETLNLSARGVAIQTGQPLSLGTAVELRLALEGVDGPWRGVVVRSRRVVSGTFEIGVLLSVDAPQA